jgi:Transposase IS116/IS110/IS902 family
MRHRNRQLTYSDEPIERVAAHDERVQRLRTVPNVGPVTAAAFVATIDDVQRFSHAHQLEAYLGLVPREDSSGDTQRRGPITKAGSGRTRWLLIQAAVSMLRRRPPEAKALRTWALRIAARRGKPIAVVALARRLPGIQHGRNSFGAAVLRSDPGHQPVTRSRTTSLSPAPSAALPGSNRGGSGLHGRRLASLRGLRGKPPTLSPLPALDSGPW